MILWGPPGAGKTTLAKIMTRTTGVTFFEVSAVTAGVKGVREILSKGRANLDLGCKTMLFIDEIHRFNKAQQDALLHAVEDGSILLAGATTENPSFEVISPLLSRCMADRLLVPHLSGFLSTLIFPAAWIALEFSAARLNPYGTWGALGYTQHGNLPLMQFASVTGILCVVVLVTWCAAVVNWAWERQFAWGAIHSGLLLYAGVWGW